MTPSLTQIIIIALIVIIVFGSGKFPNIMENIAEGLKAFNKGLNDKDKKEVKPATKVKKASTTKKPVAKKSTSTAKKPAIKKKPATKKTPAKKAK